LEWTNEKPDKPGMYLRSNPGLQQDISQQLVFKMDGELWTYHPQNDRSRRTKIENMPDAFMWLRIPVPQHCKFIFDYDKK